MARRSSAGTHRYSPKRYPRSSRGVARRVLPPLTAVAGVAALIAVLVLANGRPSPTAGPAVAAASSASGRPSADAGPSAGGAPAPARAAATASPPARASAGSLPRASSAPASAASPSDAAARPPLTVLNNSRVSGLARRAADQFTSGGWRVVVVGNFRGRIAATTVYFEPGQEEAGRALAAQFPGIRRVHPRFAGLPGSGLTVVVTRDYPA